MADPTNLDLWQRDTDPSSTSLDIGATQDGGVIYPAELMGVSDGTPSGLFVADLTLPLVVSGVSEAPTGDIQLGYRLNAILDGAPAESTGLMDVGYVLEGSVVGQASAPTGFMKPDLIFDLQADMVDTSVPTASYSGTYDINVFRGPSGEPYSRWEAAKLSVAQETSYPRGVVTGWDQSARQYVDYGVPYTDGLVLESAKRFPSMDMVRVHPTSVLRYSEAGPLDLAFGMVNEDLPRLHSVVATMYMEAASHDLSKRWWFYRKIPALHVDYQEKFQQTAKLVERIIRDKLGPGAVLHYVNRMYYEEAGYPGPGRTPPTVIPEPPAEWDPSSDRNQTVLDDGTYNLEFVEKPVSNDALTILPRKVYTVMNEVRLFMVPSGDEIPLLAMSVDIDVDAWAWGHKLSVPYESLPLFVPEQGAATPVVDLHINGTVFRLLVEKVGTRRTFNRKTLELSGRGISAYLSDPYAPKTTFTTNTPLTANQLMEQVLTFNGQSIGWSVDWGISDWQVASGLWSINGTYMDAVKSIVEAAGAFILPDPQLKVLRIRPRYPALPWHWGTASPHYVIPTDVVVQESVDWIEKPAYNGVYVSGTSQGYLGFVRRDGTSGDVQAPMVTHPLNTGVEAARQRGEYILSQTGVMAELKISLPVLPETGIILPGKLIQYQEGGQDRMGVTTSVSVTQRNGTPTLRQEVGVTTHG